MIHLMPNNLAHLWLFHRVQAPNFRGSLGGFRCSFDDEHLNWKFRPERITNFPASNCDALELRRTSQLWWSPIVLFQLWFPMTLRDQWLSAVTHNSPKVFAQSADDVGSGENSDSEGSKSVTRARTFAALPNCANCHFCQPDVSIRTPIAAVDSSTWMGARQSSPPNSCSPLAVQIEYKSLISKFRKLTNTFASIGKEIQTSAS